MMQFKEECLEENTVVHLKTLEQCNEFSKWLNNKGVRWYTEVRYTDDNQWFVYKENTCYNPAGQSFGSFSYYKGKGHKILPYEEALLKEEHSLHIIDPKKCKRYRVWDTEEEKAENKIRYGICIVNGYISCIADYYEKQFFNEGFVDCILWKHWEEVKPNSKLDDLTKELKDLEREFSCKIKDIEQKIEELVWQFKIFGWPK